MLIIMVTSVKEMPKYKKIFDKMIITLKNCLRNMILIIEDVEDNWMIYDLFMRQRNLINNQIDSLIKVKKKNA